MHSLSCKARGGLEALNWLRDAHPTRRSSHRGVKGLRVKQSRVGLQWSARPCLWCAVPSFKDSGRTQRRRPDTVLCRAHWWHGNRNAGTEPSCSKRGTETPPAASESRSKCTKRSDRFLASHARALAQLPSLPRIAISHCIALSAHCFSSTAASQARVL